MQCGAARMYQGERLLTVGVVGGRLRGHHEAGTTKTSSPPDRGVSWAASTPVHASTRRTARMMRLDVDDNLERVADALRVGAERVVDLIEGEVMGDDRVGQHLARAH